MQGLKIASCVGAYCINWWVKTISWKLNKLTPGTKQGELELRRTNPHLLAPNFIPAFYGVVQSDVKQVEDQGGSLRRIRQK